jgi:hypothetical protein
MLEILTTEQPCILCAQPLEVVALYKDEVTGEEHIERSRLDHNDVECRRILALYREAFPWQSAR